MNTLFPKIYNGIFTIKYPFRIANFGNVDHATFKIAIVKNGALAGKRIVSKLVGPDNENNYVGFAFADESKITGWRKCDYIGSAFTRHTSELQKLMLLDAAAIAADPEVAGCQIVASRHCYRCNRLLTTPESIAAGIGPECAEKMQ